MAEVVSIHELIPQDLSGRYARSGFVYQDHVSASFCLCTLLDPTLKEIWLESHDDITLIWDEDSAELVELVQVKATDETSRWSIARITARDNLRVGTSIVEKSLNGAKFKEPVKFRVVSLYDVTDDLHVLKLPIGCKERNTLASAEDTLSKELGIKLPSFAGPNGNTPTDWAKRCFWDKRPDSVDALRSSNLMQLEQVLGKYGFLIYADQRDELYQQLLARCQDAATSPINGNHDLYKMKRTEIESWLKESVANLRNPAGGTLKLRGKLEAAKLVNDNIDSAVDLKRLYSDARRTNDFMQPSEFEQLELAVNGEMYRLKIDLDNGVISEDKFHELCLGKVDEILDGPLSGKNIPKTLAYGYLYDLTNRCLHRYKRPAL